MSESMDALDKMVLGEPTDETVSDGFEQDAAAEVGESTTLKAEEVQVDGANETTILVANPLVATDQMELDEEGKDTIKVEVSTTPKKRGADVNSEQSPSPQKKRTPSKAENAKNGDTDTTVAAESQTPRKKATPAKAKKVATEAADGEEAGKDDKHGVEPATPKKKRAPAKPKNATPKVATDNIEAGDDGEITTTPKAKTSPSKSKDNDDGTPRKRAPANAIAPSRGIPTSWDDASDADRLLVNMKNDGTDWNTIRAAWKKCTGQDTAPSTLPNRYNRIKVNMMRLNDGDDKILLAAKESVEHKFQNEKWALVATEMEANGANKYPTLFIQKMFKELSAKPLENGTPAAAATTAEDPRKEDEAMAEE